MLSSRAEAPIAGRSAPPSTVARLGAGRPDPRSIAPLRMTAQQRVADAVRTRSVPQVPAPPADSRKQRDEEHRGGHGRVPNVWTTGNIAPRAADRSEE